MKRSAPDHPKMTRLAVLLKLERWGAVGIMESLWHFVAKHAIQGDIGKWQDEEIAAAIGWTADPTQLITALVDAGWLDRCKSRRLVVHDWHEHAEESVKKTIANRELDFYRAESFQKIRENSRRVGSKKGYGSGTGSGKALAEGGVGETPAPCPCGFDQFWEVYPRKEGKIKAREAFQKAVKLLRQDLRFQEQDPVEYLISKATEFASTPRGQAGQYCPHPTTWLHQGRYDDDPATWQDRASENNQPKQPSIDLPGATS